MPKDHKYIKRSNRFTTKQFLINQIKKDAIIPVKKCHINNKIILLYKLTDLAINSREFNQEELSLKLHHGLVSITIPNKIVKLSSQRNKLRRNLKRIIIELQKNLDIYGKLFISVIIRDINFDITEFKLLFKTKCLENLETWQN